MRTFLFTLFIAMLLSACNEVSEESIADAAKRCDFIVLANIETNSGSVIYRMERLISNHSGRAPSIASNAPLPGYDFPVAPNTSYGDKALVLFTLRDGRLRGEHVLVFSGGRSVEGNEPLDIVIGRVKRVAESSRSEK